MFDHKTARMEGVLAAILAPKAISKKHGKRPWARAPDHRGKSEAPYVPWQGLYPLHSMRLIR